MVCNLLLERDDDERGPAAGSEQEPAPERGAKSVSALGSRSTRVNRTNPSAADMTIDSHCAGVVRSLGRDPRTPRSSAGGNLSGGSRVLLVIRFILGDFGQGPVGLEHSLHLPGDP